MRHVLTVHGISTRGEWQQTIVPILAPFFDSKAIRYRHYRWFGGLKLVIEPWILVLFLIVPLLPWWYGWLAGWSIVAAEPVALLLGLVAAYAASPIRRWFALRSVMRQASPHMQDRAPHIIAHSFGSYLAGTMLQKYPAARAKRVVLVGCVLDTHWDWIGLRGKKPDAFCEVRNDWTTHDSVVWLAGLITRRIPGFGEAGRSKFQGSHPLIHSVAHPTAMCVSCNAATGLLHNVDCSGLGHSDAFIGPAHAARFWLPYLWGIEPAEYGNLLDMCESAVDLHELGDMRRLTIVEDELLNRKWRWAGETLRNYVADLVKADTRRGGRTVNELVGRIVRVFWQTLERARLARMTSDPSEARWVVYLYPWRAVAHGVEQVLSSP